VNVIAWLQRFLIGYPELTLFLAISIGYAIGGVKVRGFSLGPVTGSLFAGILQAHLAVRGAFLTLRMPIIGELGCGCAGG
jgi:Predicted Permease Membrane Region